MTQIVLPRMVVNKKGVIVNVSSAAGHNEGLLRCSVYSGTKVGYYKVFELASGLTECSKRHVRHVSVHPLKEKKIARRLELLLYSPMKLDHLGRRDQIESFKLKLPFDGMTMFPRYKTRCITSNCLSNSGTKCRVKDTPYLIRSMGVTAIDSIDFSD